ncbi:unnamed protein product [Linum tenue]|uniref:Uncharacterized protein n=1 Tax=Linum tenue TaxID=586396 RepID=A0AAV0HTP7_9ROSI|nr:unnamed protein product [Linum tenue]
MSESFSMFDACISIFDMEKRRRPYHRFCDCALHKLKRSSSGRNDDGSNMAIACLRRSVTFPGEKRTAAKMNRRGRLCFVGWVETTSKKPGAAAGENNVGTILLIEDES